MFTNDSSEIWDSSEFQDAFIKEYFGKGKASKEESKCTLYPRDEFKSLDSKKALKRLHHDSEDQKYVKSASEESKNVSNISGSTKKKKKISNSPSKDKFVKNGLNNLELSEIKFDSVADSSSLKSKKKRKQKSKNKKKVAVEEQALLNLKHLHHDSEDQIYVKSGPKESKDISDISGTTKKKISNFPPEAKFLKNGVNSLKLSETKFDSVADSSSLKSKKKRKRKSKNTNKVGVEEQSLSNLPHQGTSKQMNDSQNLQEEKIYSEEKDSLYGNKLLKFDSVADPSSLKFKKKRKRKSKNKNKVGVVEQALLNLSHQETSKEMNDSQNLQKKEEIYSNCFEKKNSLYQNKLCQKLQGAKFRYLNEMLYTSTGKDALSYFQENKDEFQDYHVGYQSQVSKWPINPVDVIIEELRHMNKQCIIADLGCGEAKIAEAFPQRTVHSFDLIALKDYVTACDMANVPLPSGSVDVVVFCLSLMGTNWKDYLKEGHRLLKLGGELKIAEIESRIDDVNDFIKNIQAYGFSLENKDMSHKMFIFLNFKKVKNKVKVSKISNVTLKPCLYKRR